MRNFSIITDVDDQRLNNNHVSYCIEGIFVVDDIFPKKYIFYLKENNAFDKRFQCLSDVNVNLMLLTHIH